MIRALKILAVLVVILVGTVLAIFLTGRTASVVGWLLMPGHDWDPVRTAPAPDYARAGNWAAFPGKASFALFSPLGVSNQPGPHPVDVFFIHPTGYLNHAEWNSPLNPDSRTEENTRWMMANQASVFSGCCNIYAPRYREASLFRYLGSASPEIIKKTMDLAYGDVERAFQYYLEHENHGRPFIIASHSQGSEHGIRLLQNQIDGRPIARQLVAAYLIGNRLMTNARVAMLKTIPGCESPGEVGGLIHWAT